MSHKGTQRSHGAFAVNSSLKIYIYIYIWYCFPVDYIPVDYIPVDYIPGFMLDWLPMQLSF